MTNPMTNKEEQLYDVMVSVVTDLIDNLEYEDLKHIKEYIDDVMLSNYRAGIWPQ